MGEDAESPKINHTFLRDYVTEGTKSPLFCLLFVIVVANAFLLNCSILLADVISTVEFNQTGDLLATGDKGGRVVIFQRETEVSLQSYI